MAWQIINNELTNTEFISIPELFETSAPATMWRIKNNRLETNVFIDVPELFETSAPSILWRVADNKLTIGTPEPPLLGAFCHASKLKKVSIPNTVKKIGRYAFTNATLSSVKLAADCEYYSASFPAECRVSGGILIE